MSSYSVNVRWGSKVLPNVELGAGDTVSDFKTKLFSLTNVAPDRQKLIHAGKLVTDEMSDLSSLQLRDGMTFMLIGSSGDIQNAPSKSSILASKVDDAVKPASTISPGKGIRNIGNTCYINSVIQLLRAAPAFVNEVDALSKIHSSNKYTLLCESILTLLRQVRTGADPLSVNQVVHILLREFPQFAGSTDDGPFDQQDANECMLCVMRAFAEYTQSIRNTVQILLIRQTFLEIHRNHGTERVEIKSANGVQEDKVGKYFRIQMCVTKTSTNEAEEAPQKSLENVMDLSCFITKEIKEMITGIKSKLNENVELKVEGSEEMRQYNRTSLINRLPQFLKVVFVRFFYREDVNVNAKILKEVTFPFRFDVYAMCSEELQQKIKPMREKILKYDDKKARVLGRDEKVKMTKVCLEGDEGSSNSGMYELAGVLTHKGRSSATGHYVAWLNRAEPCQKPAWFQFDDSNVVPIIEKQIMQLAGGGDWHSAYILLYRSRSIPEDEKYW